jgi:hypothetical protein
MLRKMGKPDTLRVLYRKVLVCKGWRVVQLDSVWIWFSELRLVAARVSESKGVDLWTVLQTIEDSVGASQCPLGFF